MKRAFVFLLLLPGLCAAQDTRAVVAVWCQGCEGNQCVQMRGSGVCIGTREDSGNLLVLTAAHVVRGTSTVNVYVNRQWQAARVVNATKKDGNWDLALLEVEYREPWSYVRFLRDALRYERGEVTIQGYEGGQKWVGKRGIFGRRDKFWLYWSGAQPREGTSGGAVMFGDVLAGIISGYEANGSGIGVAQNAEAIGVFLDACKIRIRFYRPEPPAQQQQQPGIPNPAQGPQPGDVIANPAKGPDASNQIAALSKEVSDLRAQLQALKERGITVELRDAESKQVKSRTFAPGEPIRLQLPARQNTGE